ncbi:MAG: four helix bundle protein [bacterium]
MAEGSGSSSKKEFSNFLNFPRRATFETANILVILHRRILISQETHNSLFKEFDYLCGKITTFRKSLFD